MSKQVWSVICSFVILSGCYIPEEVPESRMKGYVGFSYPIAGGHVRVWELDPFDGSLVHSEPIAEAITDENGEFDIDMTGLRGMLLITVHGGMTKEYWDLSAKFVGMGIHSTVIVPQWPIGEDRTVAITPWTTLADIIASARQRTGIDDSIYYFVALAANHDIYEHVVKPVIHEEIIRRNTCESDLTCLVPYTADTVGDVFDRLGLEDEAVLYTASLLSLSATARARYSREHGTQDVQKARTKQVLDDLLSDIQDDALINGTSSTNTSSDTLRLDLPRDAVQEYWSTDFNRTGITAGDLADYFCRIARRQNVWLFGENSVSSDPPECGF